MWTALLAVVAIFALAFAIYRDLKTPARPWPLVGKKMDGLAVALYNGHFRPIWQRAPRAQFDPELVYVPAPGRFRFYGPEFDTWVTMTAEGVRQQPAPSPDLAAQDLIVVAGDSYAMGWGVNDAETFSAVLQERYRHHTINTGVSSYGTARELLRLRRLGLLARASVIVLQYCGNDAEENRAFLLHNQVSSRRPHKAWEHVNQGAQVELSYGRVLGGTVALLRGHLLAKVAALFRSTADVVPAPPASDAPSRGGRRNDPAGSPAEEFLAVLDRFPELNDKPILVFEADVWREPPKLAGLEKLAATRANLHLLTPNLEDADYFRFDAHFNVRGHEVVAAELDRALRALRAKTPAARP